MIIKDVAIYEIDSLSKYTNDKSAILISAKSVVNKIYNSIGRCGDCKFQNDERKCPMASPEIMDDENYCYAFYKKEKQC